MATLAAVRFSGVTRRFPGVVALDSVSFDVMPGEVHAVCGENGAGKSTLGRILAGIQQADEGEIVLDGALVKFATPREAMARGVAMVHQELAFCDNMSVAENLLLSRLPSRWGFVQRGALHRDAASLLAEVGATSIDPSRAMASLSIAEQQVVQITASVAAGARVVIFDEPTSSLGEGEAERLFALMGDLKQRGVTMLYVSHRMPEIFRLCDRITVLRDGRHVSTRLTSETTEADLVREMIGRPVGQYFGGHTRVAAGEELLRVDSLSSPGRFSNVSFSLRRGEVLGLAGLVGAGRSEVAQAIFGLDPRATGRMRVRGENVRIRTPRDAMAHGLGLVPEDRKKQGLVLGMVARENTTLASLPSMSQRGWINRVRERAVASSYFERLRVRSTVMEAPAVQLSGGNQQKLVLAKWLAAKSEILLLDEPTRGVDIGAKAELHAWIDRLAADGAAVLLISSELPELLNLSTRIIVLRAGNVVGELAREDATQDRLLRLMTGLGASSEPQPLREHSV
ncbi:MAG: sugar ABC transporter ATP-binding protein [Gemmatimonadaceae bacterium]